LTYAERIIALAPDGLINHVADGDPCSKSKVGTTVSRAPQDM